MSMGYKAEIDTTNQAMRVIFQDEEAHEVLESPNGIAKCGIAFDGADTYICWVELYDRNKVTLIMDWIGLAVQQALGDDDDDYWQPSVEILPVVRP